MDKKLAGDTTDSRGGNSASDAANERGGNPAADTGCDRGGSPSADDCNSNPAADLVFRLGVLEDFDEIVAFYNDMIEATTGTDNDPIWVMGEHPSEEDITGAIAAGEFLTAWCHGRLASVAIVNNCAATGYDATPWQTPYPQSEAAILHLFGVHPDFAGQGVGRRMVEHVESTARDRGFKVLRLDTLESNIGARAMYNKLGFTDCGYIELHYDDTDLTDFHMFEKPL